MIRTITFILATIFLISCSGGSGGNGDSGGLCDGFCVHQSLTESDVSVILSNAVTASNSLGKPSTIAVTDRTGNVLAVYQMTNAQSSSVINGGIGAVGGLEGKVVPANFVAISKAGTGAYLSSQGNAFSTRTASQIIQEHFNPGQNNQPGGPLFGVQFSQLLCSDVKDSTLGPRPLPLGLSADPGGLPLYKNGDLVGGIGIEVDGVYRLDRNIENTDNDDEEIIAVYGSSGFEAPAGIIANLITVGGQSLRFSDIDYLSAKSLIGDQLPAQIEQANITSPIRAGIPFGTVGSGVIESTRAGLPSAYLVKADSAPRFPSKAGSALSVDEVNALLDSALLTAGRMRAAIRRPLNTAVRVSIFVVDAKGDPLGFVRSNDAPVFGIDVALQKARTAAFFSSPDASAELSAAGFGSYSSRAESLLGTAFNGNFAFTNRAIGNISRPYFLDGIDGSAPGPLSLNFPGTGGGSTWSPFNTGLQLDLVLSGLLAPLSDNIPNSCAGSQIGKRLGNGIQIFSGSVPLYKGTTLIGAIGISGDGIFQDDMVAFYGAGRKGLDFAGHTEIGDPKLGFNAPIEIRSDNILTLQGNSRLRYISCPESPFIDGNEQDACGNM